MGVNILHILQRRKTRAIIAQISLVSLVIVGFTFFIQNAIINMEKIGLKLGFGYFFEKAGFDLSSPFINFSTNSTYFEAYILGLLNTISAAITCIVLATIIGFFISLLRLSNNWLVSKVSYIYVEILRNLPVLLLIICFYYGVLQQLPSIKNALALGDFIFLSNRGLYTPRLIFNEGSIFIFIAITLSAIFAIWYKRKINSIQRNTGQQKPYIRIVLPVIILSAMLGYIIGGSPIGIEIPELKGFNFKGGMSLKPEFVALVMGIVLYESARNAEIIRAGITSVSKGQEEAAHSLNLSYYQTINKIIVPQALRVIIPPMNSQYLNMVKNTSLAVSIGYTDLVTVVGELTLNQVGHAIENISIIMATYLIISLSISYGMNKLNKKVALIGQ